MHLQWRFPRVTRYELALNGTELIPILGQVPHSSWNDVLPDTAIAN
jgi:hypothetical protein